MLTRKLFSLALLFAIALPAALAAAQSAPPVEPNEPIVPAEPAQPAEEASIVGKWMLKSVEADGEIEELEDGAFVAEFMADGTMKTYEDGEPLETGRYTIEGDTITVYLGDDQEGESSTFSIDGTTMTVKQEVPPGVEMTITFVRVAGE